MSDATWTSHDEDNMRVRRLLDEGLRVGQSITVPLSELGIDPVDPPVEPVTMHVTHVDASTITVEHTRSRT